MRLKFFNFFKKYKPVLLVFLVFSFSFLIAPSVSANWVNTVVGGITYLLMALLGLILTLVMKGLILIVSYQDFIGAGAVVEGWIVVRDLANMFFVVILLIIAFATILHLEDYNYKKWLPKLILMAVLINFSKTICGLMIDVAQIIMLTFVNSFRDVAGGNFVDMLGIKSIVTLSENSKTVSNWAIVGAYLLGIIYMIVALVVITTMMMVLVMRLVMIWIYVVLSPLAYLLSAFPGGQSYAKQWWSEFIKNLVVGPVLAFFIWLSFAALQTGSYGNSAIEGGAPIALTEASTPGALIKFVIGIGMLIGGLKISQQIGGAAGSVAGKGMSKLSSMSTGAMNFGKKAAIGGAVNVGLGVAKKTKLAEGLGSIASSDGVVGKILAATGIRSLATNSLVGLNRQQKKVEDKAQAKVGDLKDTRVIARYANQKSLTGSGQAMQKKASDMMPSAIKNTKKMQEKIAGMSREDLGKLSDAEWFSIGKRGAKLGGKAPGFLEKDSEARGAYNLGNKRSPAGHLTPRGAPLITGTRADGAPLAANVYGSYYEKELNGTLSKEDDETLKRADHHKYDYYKDAPKLEEQGVNKVPEQDQNEDRGQGSTAVNKFSRGQSTLAVDFDRLNIKDIGKGQEGDSDWRNTRGVNTSDPGGIKQIADRMVQILDEDISALKAKPNLNAGETKRLDNLQASKQRFENPQEISNLSVVNSSASKFKMTDVKESIIHEEVHGLGYENEEDVRSATSKIMASRDYDARKDKGSIDKILVDKPRENRSVPDIIDDENKINLDGKNEINLDDKYGGGADVNLDTKNLEKNLTILSGKMEGIAKKIGGIGGSTSIPSSKPVDLAGSLKPLIKELSSGNKKVGSYIASVGGEKAETALELSFIAKNVPQDQKPDVQEI